MHSLAPLNNHIHQSGQLMMHAGKPRQNYLENIRCQTVMIISDKCIRFIQSSYKKS